MRQFHKAGEIEPEMQDIPACLLLLLVETDCQKNPFWEQIANLAAESKRI